jgi:hypothetical protein
MVFKSKVFRIVVPLANQEKQSPATIAVVTAPVKMPKAQETNRAPAKQEIAPETAAMTPKRARALMGVRMVA